MALSEELLEQIGAYLSDRMTTGEKDRFDARLQQDASLRDEVAIQREIKEGLLFIAQKERFKAMHGDLDARGLLSNPPESPTSSADRPQSAETGLRPTLTPKRTLFREQWAYFAMAAVLVLVLGFGWVIYRNQESRQAQLAQNARTFDAFFSPDLKPLPVLPPDPDRVAAPQTGASVNAGSDSIRLRTAILLLQRSETQVAVAIDTLQVLARTVPGHWSASAQWYLVLAYLKTNQRQQARQLATQLAGLNGHPFQQEAEQLLSELSKTPSQPR